jgi:hypothetical protein
MALALSPDGSAEAICALALATDAGIADTLGSAASFSTAFLVSLLSEDFEPAFAYLRWAIRFPLREDCLPDVAISDFDAAAGSLLAPAALDGDCPANHTNSPAVSIKAERPLALIVIWQSPHLPAPIRAKRPRRVSRARQKKGIFGQLPAKAGQLHCIERLFPGIFLAPACLEPRRRVRARAIDVMSLPGREPSGRFR